MLQSRRDMYRESRSVAIHLITVASFNPFFTSSNKFGLRRAAVWHTGIFWTKKSINDVEKIKSEWGQGVIASNGVGKSAGVMILIPDNVPYENVYTDSNGRIAACYLPTPNINLVNGYSHVHSKPKEQLQYLKDLISFTDNLPNLICGGDTNIVLNELLDRKSNVKYIKTKVDHLFEICFVTAPLRK